MSEHPVSVVGTTQLEIPIRDPVISDRNLVETRRWAAKAADAGRRWPMDWMDSLWVLKFRYAPNSLDISSLRIRPHTS